VPSGWKCSVPNSKEIREVMSLHASFQVASTLPVFV
jgi:hypothetical protein